jgi:hypothetical protein
MSFTEDLLLPSRGIIYRLPDFDGNVKVKQFTTKNYKNLLVGNASEAAIRQFVDECLVNCPVKAKNMNQNDVLAVLFKTRVMTLGNMLKTQVRCPSCKKTETVDFDLNDVEINYLFADEYPIPVKLPISCKEIKVRFPTGYDMNKAKQEAERRATSFNRQSSEFMEIFATASMIDVDNMDIVEKAEWYESLNPQDAIYLDSVFSELANVFGVKLTRSVKCSSCDYEYSTYIDIGSDFFRTAGNVSLGITSKKGNLGHAIKESDIS